MMAVKDSDGGHGASGGGARRQEVAVGGKYKLDGLPAGYVKKEGRWGDWQNPQIRRGHQHQKVLRGQIIDVAFIASLKIV